MVSSQLFLTFVIAIFFLNVVIGGLSVACFLYLFFIVRDLHKRTKENRTMIKGVDVGIQGITHRLLEFALLAQRVEIVLEKIKRWQGGRNSEGK